jgi:imidazole glycerol-phosphate synthase subunit HisH
VIALIDYKAGNLTSVKKALATIGADVYVPGTPEELADASGVIVPGVGHFGATRALDGAWTEAILARVGEGRPLFGICLGMQWLYEGSDEAPDAAGLGLLSGRSYKMTGDSPIKIPHVGWNNLSIRQRTSMVEGIPANAQVYFTHSYACPVNGDTSATTAHGTEFAAVVQRGHVAGVQFHPEKSGDVGLQILRNFLELVA